MNDSGMELNKIAGAILLAGIIAMISGFMSEGLYTGSLGHHEEHEVKRGFTIAGAEETAAPGETQAAEAAPVDIVPLLAAADVATGEKLVKKCTACHTFEKGGKNGVGPNQWGLVGRKVAGAPGYTYSDALQKISGSWTPQMLSEFITNPKKYAPGNKMSFAGIKDPKDRANLIAYLNTLK